MIKICRYFLTLLSLFYWASLFSKAQEAPAKQISEVTISENNAEYFSDDHTKQSIDPALAHLKGSQNLGYLLESLTPALIRTYGGSGSLTSVSLNGTGSNHTQVSWNGFPLNSPSTGQADLSLIPPGFMQSVVIVNGASGALFGSGTFGGYIELLNDPDWNKQVSVNYSFTTGSFGSISNLLSAKVGNLKWQYQLTALIEKAENDFTYRDHYKYLSPEVRVDHNAFKSTGIMQNLYLKLNNGNIIETGIWYQNKGFEIPALMGSYDESHANQKDSLFRSFISYKKTGQKSALLIKSAYFSDFLNYTDKLNEIDTFNILDSRISTARFMNDLNYRYYLSSKIIVGGGASLNYTTGNSNNYGDKISENEYAVFINAKLVFRNLSINTGLRKEFYEGLNPGLQYSFGFRYKINDRLSLLSGFSSKFRKPTFNEKYWKPGGNPNLKPEKGRGGDLTIEWAVLGSRKDNFWLDLRLNGYYQWIDNWIQWVVNDSLTPLEFKKVHAKGLEAGLEYGINLSSLKISGSVKYNYNRSVIVDTYDHNDLLKGNQLMYVPLNSIQVNYQTRFKWLASGFSLSCFGSRETVETGDINLRLPAYTVCNLYAGFYKQIMHIDLSAYFQISNLFDKAYELIRSYPLPGRAYHFVLTIGIDKIKSQN